MLQLRQQRAHLRVLAKGELEARLDAFPHPGQGLLFAALGEAAVSGLQPLVFAHCGPEAIHTLPQQRADLHHLGVPLGFVVVGVFGVTVLAQQAQAGSDLRLGPRGAWRDIVLMEKTLGAGDTTSPE